LFYRQKDRISERGIAPPSQRAIPFAEREQEHIPHTERWDLHRHGVPLPPTDLDKKLAAFLKKQRGEMSYAEFSRKTGLTASSLFRLEQGQQSITLGRLHEVLKKLKMSLWDVLGGK